ncbi:MAG: glycosyltransferase, partial [Anaerolineae bacterium]|nr:glycosyltransferase [Anaerolineae bacterium]
MNIAFVAPFGLAPKGTTRWRVLPLARALAARGHSVRVLVPSWDWPQDAGRAWREGGADVVSIPFPAALGKAAWPILLARLLAEARRGKSDVVHVFKPIGFSGAIAQAMLRLPARQRPLVWADADDLETAWADARPAWQRAAIAHQERWVLFRADGVTAASRALLQHVAEWRSTPPVYLPNTSALHPVDTDEVPGRVVWYTRFLDIAPETAADIWAAIVGNTVWGNTVGAGLRPAPTPPTPPTLHVIGVGMHGEECAFAEAVRARGLSGTVVMRGYLEGEALASELGSACAAILPFADTPRN